MLADDDEVLHLSINVEMCSIFTSRFGSSIGGQFHDAQCSEDPF
jgi:hypothetical protein